MGFATNGSCELFYEQFGDPADPVLLLVNGLGSQCINYHTDWCQKFAGRGLHVVRFDNRDVGLSTKFDTAPTGPFGEAYLVSDMVADGVAVLDAIGVERAHVMGLSMGGMIVQRMAIERPDRLLSMTSVMSRTDEPGYGESTPEALAALMAPEPTDRQTFIAGSVAGLRIWGSSAFADEARWRRESERAFERCFHPSGPTRQARAIHASGPWADLLRHLTTPTLVIHGDCDTLIDQSGGRRTAELIPGARFELIEGMGHDYPPQLWDRWVDLVAGFALGH